MDGLPADWPFWLPFVGLGVLLAAAVVVERRRRKRRVAALGMLAEELGFGFLERALGPGDPRLDRLPLFRLGRSPRTTNLLRHESTSSTTLVFDYRYTIGRGKHTRRPEQTVVALCREHADWPEMQFFPETLGLWIAGVFGGHDIDFVDRPTFSKAFALRGGDEDAIRAFLSDAILDIVESHPGWSFEACGSWLIMFRARRLMPVPEVASAIDELRRLEAAFAAPRRGSTLR